MLLIKGAGNCQRPVLSLGVSNTKSVKISSKFQESNERKNTLVGQISVMKSFNNYLFLKNYVTLQGRKFLIMFYTLNSSLVVICFITDKRHDPD